MAYRSFRKFLGALEQANELKRVTVPVDTNLLIAEWADREMKSPGGGKALFFEQPITEGKKSEFPVAINTMGSRRRMALALQVADIGDIAQEIQLILKAKPPTDLREGWSLLKQGIHLLHARPKHVHEAPCQEIVHKIDTGDNFSLGDLPILKCWPKDGGRFITLANVHTRDPETGARNVGIYRMQIYDGRTTGMHWQIHKVGARHGKRYYERGDRMPVAVTLGGDPVYTFAATAPLPDGLDELLFAGFLRKKSIELVRCKTVDLDVPADVDFVLEGYVQPGEMRLEGPFGDHTGFYTRLLYRRCLCAYFPAGIQNEFPGNRGHDATAGRGFSQSGLRQHPETVSLSGLQGHARPLGDGPDDVQQIYCGGRRGLRRSQYERGALSIVREY